MSQRTLAALGDLLQNSATPSGAELLELDDLIRRAETAMSGRDRDIPGSTWIGDRFIDLLQRRITGKPIHRAEVDKLTQLIVDHGEWLRITQGQDVHNEGWTRTLAALAHIADTVDRPSPRSAKVRRDQHATYGLLTATVLSPPTRRRIRCDLPL